jgi:hypothetical protein
MLGVGEEAVGVVHIYRKVTASSVMNQRALANKANKLTS